VLPKLTVTFRTRGFLYIIVTALTSEFVGAPIASIVYPLIGPHSTFVLAQPLGMLGLIFLKFMPQSQNIPSHEATENDVHPEGFRSVLMKKVRAMKAHMHNDVLPMLSRPLLFLGLLSLFANRLARPILTMFVQYTAAKFHWTIAKVCRWCLTRSMLIIFKGNFLLSLNAGIQLVLFLSVLPYVQAKLVKMWKNTQAADLIFSRWCIPFYVVGFLMMGLATRPPVFIFGELPYF
jgi:hypothetical protein